MNAIVQSYNTESGKAVLQAVIPFLKLKEIAKFSYRIRPLNDPYSSNVDEYQRELNCKHVGEIKKFLRNSILNKNNLGIFPTALLLAFNIEPELLEKMNSSDEIVNIDLQDSCYVVDGQHRLRAMIDLYDDASNDDISNNREIRQFLMSYKFCCSILVNFDMWEQACVFADVNFKQKRVNKSLYYDIYGAYYSENPADWRRNTVYLAHSLVEYINSSKESPLFHQIKMLGNGSGTISQAFLVEALLPHISTPKGIWYVDPYKEVMSERLNVMKVELFSYLKVVSSLFEPLWTGDKSIIKKTTGIGALLRLMGVIHEKLSSETMKDLEKQHKDNLSVDYMEKISKFLSKLKPKMEYFFSSDTEKGHFCGTGGRGLEMQLFKEIKKEIFPENEKF